MIFFYTGDPLYSQELRSRTFPGIQKPYSYKKLKIEFSSCENSISSTVQDKKAAFLHRDFFQCDEAMEILGFFSNKRRKYSFFMNLLLILKIIGESFASNRKNSCTHFYMAAESIHILEILNPLTLLYQFQ